jgi:chitodextrinase
MVLNTLSCREHGNGSSSSRRLVLIGLLLLLGWGSDAPASAQGQPITFSVIADIPYSSSAESLFLGFVDDHNLYSPSEFFVHVGDIKSGTTSCVESRYATTANTLAQLSVPTFILPGDNEWNDCSNPNAAWQLWESYFTDFEQAYCGTPPVEAQAVRHENFAFVSKGVLFVGLNVVGGTVHDSDEWDTRLQQDADWVDLQFTQKAGQVRAAVVFGHAGPDSDRTIFFDQFEASSAALGKPVLYIMGDDHSWVFDNPFSESNMARITIERDDPPLEVTVLMDAQDPWLVERVPWPSGTPVLNQPPCVEVGPDQTLGLGQAATLSGFVTDDGVPVQGNVSLTWSKVSGPGSVTIDDASAADTTATFSTAGSYVLRLVANDGALTGQDQLAVEVESGGPTLKINDVSVTEGDSGTVQAVFSVDLQSETGGLVTVDYATSNGTATAGSDYQSTSGNLSFSGSTTQRSVSVPVLGDTDTEEFETFDVNLTNPSGAEITDGVGTGMIVDDDAPSIPTVNSFSPPSGPAGSLVVLTGDSFTGTTAVTLGGTLASFSVVSDARIDVVVPGGASSGPIRVTNAAGTGSSASDFLVEFEVVVSTDGSGTVDLQPAGGFYSEGSTVTLTPVPSSGWSFLSWSGDLAGADDPAILTVDADKSVTATFVETGGADPVTVVVPIASSTDDAEEEIASGVMDLTSSDLELGVEKSPQLVGMRFPGVSIPRGASILSANLQFTVDEVSTGSASLSLRGELSGDAAPFSSSAFDISGRPTTAAMVGWSPPDWPSVGASGAAQRSVDLKVLVQEIVSQSAWTSGNALAFIVTGIGTRTAESSRAGPAPVLEVVYVDVPDTEKPSPPQNLASPTQTETTITLVWDPSIDNVGVSGYRVYGPNGTTDVVGTSHVETGLLPSTSYGCQVSALDAAGNESDLSAVLTVQTAAPDTEKPSTPQNLISPAQTGTTISLSWDASTDNVGVTGYRVYGPNGVTTVPGTSHVEVGLAPSTSYSFQVSALDLAGNESDPSSALDVSTGVSEPVTLTIQIANADDDAEENMVSGNINLTSGDLELGEANAPQRVGLRFPGVSISQGATILSAHLQFAVDEVSTGAASLQVRGELSENAARYTSANSDIGGRPTTSAVASWSPPDWTTVGSSGPAQRTGDLGALVQEIVSQPGWASGNALALVVTGSGTRTAESSKSGPAPVLEIVYVDTPDTQKPSTPQNLVSPDQTETTITLSWDASTDDVGVTGYRVYGPNGTTDVTGSGHVETGLAATTSYDFQVSALDAAGNESDLSSVLTVATAAPDTQKPSVPQNLISSAQTGTTISLSWDASADNVGVVGYRVYGPNGTTDVPDTSHVETGLAPSTFYSFQVTALDASGNESDLSTALDVQTGAASSITLSVLVASSTDDAEQRVSSGAMKLASSDLELILDKTREQIVGLRFVGVDVPRGATIESAHVQFTADEAHSEPTSLVIHGEASGDAAAFASTASDLSGRTTTAASVAWSPAPWSVGAAGSDQSTEELASVVQEIVDRSDWSAGNALVLILSGEGRRVAESYDGTAPPELVIQYLP